MKMVLETNECKIIFKMWQITAVKCLMLNFKSYFSVHAQRITQASTCARTETARGRCCWFWRPDQQQIVDKTHRPIFLLF